jgi:hypothetical protein
MPTLFEPRSERLPDWARDILAEPSRTPSASPEPWSVEPKKVSPHNDAAFTSSDDLDPPVLFQEAQDVHRQVVRLRKEVAAALGAHVEAGPASRTAVEGGAHSCVNHKKAAHFLRAFRANPEQAVEALLLEVTAKNLPPEQAAAILLPYLVKASYAQQSLVAGALELVATPEQILTAAVALYERSRDPRLLSTADQLLASYGSASWPALKSLCGSMRPECRYFVNTVATLDQISGDERREALLLLARNPDLETRQEVLTALEMEVLAEPLPVWEILAQDRDGSIAAIAAGRVAVLAE